jgi:hypothetical protein
MKKNILLVQSLFAVPLLTSSLLFSMDAPAGTTLNDQTMIVHDDIQNPQILYTTAELIAATRKLAKSGTDVEELRKSLLALAKSTPITDSSPTQQQPRDQKELFAELLLEIRAEGAERKRTKEKAETTVINELETSVYNPAPTIKQGLSWSERGKTLISAKWFPTEAIKAKTFDAENADHMASLMTAAHQLVLESDSAALLDLLRNCRKNYPNIKLDKKVAREIQTRFKFDKEDTTQEYHEAIARENAKFISKQEEIFAKNDFLLARMRGELDASITELGKTQVAYMVATQNIIQEHNKKLGDISQGDKNLLKLNRKLIKDQTPGSPYLTALNSTDTQLRNGYHNLNVLDIITKTLQDTAPLLKPQLIRPAKNDVLTLTNK